MSDIKIMYWEGDDSHMMKKPFTRLTYAEWLQDGVSDAGYGTDADNAYRNNPDDHALIPDDVREHIALIVAPSLDDKLGKLEDERAGWQSRALIAESSARSAQQRAHVAMTALSDLRRQLEDLMRQAAAGTYGPAIAAVARAHVDESAAP